MLDINGSFEIGRLFETVCFRQGVTTPFDNELFTIDSIPGPMVANTSLKSRVEWDPEEQRSKEEHGMGVLLDSVSLTLNIKCNCFPSDREGLCE